MLFDLIEETLKWVKTEKLYPSLYTIEGPSTNPEVLVRTEQGVRKVLMFSSTNYLGLANDPRVKKAMVDAVEIYGMDSGGSRLVSGNISVQRDLEEAIAEFKSCEAALTFSTSYMANTGIIPALLNPVAISALHRIRKKCNASGGPIVFYDEFNHASIIDACRLARAERVAYRHRDVNDLEHKLKEISHPRLKLIITDGVFSMDGDLAPLNEIADLCSQA